jgi:N-acetylglucosaminyl-diphospho-decaprenol L-rhamnosyltransferase
MTDVLLSVVVLSWNTRTMLRDCLSALQRDQDGLQREVLVVDNASADGSADMVECEFPAVRLLRNDSNRLYAEGNNQGARAARGRLLCLLNSDTQVRAGALARLVGFLLQNPDYGAVAPRLVNADGSVQRACRRFPGLLSVFFESSFLGRFPPGSWVSLRQHMGEFTHEYSRDVPQPPGACLLMLREEFLALGGLDPKLSLFFNDVDLCRALWRKGRRIRYLAEAEVMHHGGASTRTFAPSGRNLLWFKNRAAYYRKTFGRAGSMWLDAVIGLWAVEMGLRILLGPRSVPAKRQALVELNSFLREQRKP